MLELRDVSRLLTSWQRPPTIEIIKEAENYISQFKKLDSVAIFCAGISAIAIDIHNDYYRQLSTALFEIGRRKNIPIEKLMPWHVPPEQNGIDNHVYSINEAAQVSEESKQQGFSVGFLHGHYRMPTPASWANVLLAREQCDVLILGLENGRRTRMYKGVDPVSRDWERHKWVLASGFDGYLTRIGRIPYTDKGYENMLRKIKPNIYFGNMAIPEYIQQEMARRATVCGTAYVSLPTQHGYSTSQLLKASMLAS